MAIIRGPLCRLFVILNRHQKPKVAGILQGYLNKALVAGAANSALGDNGTLRHDRTGHGHIPPTGPTQHHERNRERVITILSLPGGDVEFGEWEGWAERIIPIVFDLVLYPGHNIVSVSTTSKSVRIQIIHHVEVFEYALYRSLPLAGRISGC